MFKLSDFQISFSGLKLGAHRFDFQIEDSFFQLYDYAELDSGQINAIILLQKKSNMLELEFQIRGNVTLACDTCTDNYIQSIEGNFKQIVKFSDVTELKETDEIIILSTNEHTLNVAHQLYEFIHLSLPSRRTHSDEADCNQEILEKLEELAFQEPEAIDPRWSTLQILKK
jgi:uncharacterized metal-binding protein YceD (DUF177 family)